MGLFDFWFHTQQQTAAPKIAPKTTCKKLLDADKKCTGEN